MFVFPKRDVPVLFCVFPNKLPLVAAGVVFVLPKNFLSHFVLSQLEMEQIEKQNQSESFTSLISLSVPFEPRIELLIGLT